MEYNEQIHFTINHLIETWSSITRYFSQNPEYLVNSQISYCQDYQRLCKNLSDRSQESTDKRFQHNEWQTNTLLHFIKQSYLLLSQHIDNLIKNIEPHDEKMAKKLRFYCRQWMDAVAPSNFANINPDILSKSFESNGTNLLNGLKHFLEDLEQGKGQLNIKMTDFDMFELGENIACTPGKIIYQNDLMQLIQYTATTEEIYQHPLLIIPPWINKYYILDLQQENSLVKWLVDQGFTVFMISWVNPTNHHKEKQFSDYLFDGPLSALKIIKKIIGEEKINVLGYCVGGTLLGCMLAYLSEKSNSSIVSATFLTTLLDFSDPGELGVFIDEEQISMLEKHMKSKGYLDGRIMASVFNALRANDLIWSSFVNNYLKGDKPKPFDLLYWNADSTNIPEKVHSFYLRNMYLNNDLSKPGKIKMADMPLDLSKITLPCYFLATQDDHIVPWKTSYKSKQCLNSPVKFVLASSGHVAGVINPPHKKKYGYWTNPNKLKNPDNFLKKATFHQGSWWNDWVEWLKKYSGKLLSMNHLNHNVQKIIENAPGSYVKDRLN